MAQFKRIVSMVLAFVMIFGMLPNFTLSAGATETTPPEDPCHDPSCAVHDHASEANTVPEEPIVSVETETVPPTEAPAPVVEETLPASEEEEVLPAAEEEVLPATEAPEALTYPELVPTYVSNANIENGGDVVYFQFTPAQSDRYRFYSQSEEDTYVTLYNSDMEELAHDDDGGTNDNFMLSYDLTAGVTYIYGVRFLNSDVTGIIPVILDIIHSYGEGVITREATCYEPGEYTFTCIYCDVYYTEIYTVDHNYIAEPDEFPTCTEYGSVTYTCEYCGDSYTALVDPLGHDFKDGVCANCGLALPTTALELDTPVDAVIANPGEYVYYQFTPTQTDYYRFESNADFDTYGYLYDINMYELTYDDDAGTGNNFAIGYVLEEGTTYIFGVRCYSSDRTGTIPVTLTIAHSYSGTTTTEATCTEDGLITYTCDYCGYSCTEVIPAGHIFEDGVCTRCQISITEGKTQLVLDQPISVTASAENEIAYFYFTPEVTDYYRLYMNDGNYFVLDLYDDSMDSLSKNYLNDGWKKVLQANTTYVFAVHSNEAGTYTLGLTNIHDYSSEITTESTCTEDGVRTYTCDYCGASYTEPVPAGHKFENGTCTGCGLALTEGKTPLTLDTTTDVTVSSEDEVLYFYYTVPQTDYYRLELTETGYDQDLYLVSLYDSNMTLLNDRYSDDIWRTLLEGNTYVIAVTGTPSKSASISLRIVHDYNWEDTTPATCTEDGVRTYTCRHCSASYTEPIPAGHRFEDGICAACGISVIEGKTQLTLGTPVSITATEWGEPTYFYFTATVYDLYRFRLTEDSGDWGDYYAVLYNDSMGFIGGNYYDEFTASMQEGETYIIAVYGNPSRSCTIELVQNHSFNSEDTVPPTCTEDGVRTYTCSYCGYSYTEAIPAAHTFENGTCTGCGILITEGKTQLTLGTTVSGSVSAADQVVYFYITPEVTEGYRITLRESNGDYDNFWMHLYDDSMQRLYSYYYDTMRPTLNAGETYVVAVTGSTAGSFSLTLEVSHSYEQTGFVPATCTEDGLYTYTCQYCGDSYTEVIPAHHELNGLECVNCDYSILDDAVTIVPGDSSANITTGGESVYFVFTPEYTDRYTFYSRKTNGDPYCELFDSNMDRLTSNDDGAGNLNFSVTYTLEAGQLYLFRVHYLNSSDTGILPVTLAVSHRYAETILTDRTCETDGLARYTCEYCGYSYEAVIPAGHIWRDGVCTECNADLFADMPVMPLGETVSGTLSELEQYVYYQFTPTVTDTYLFRHVDSHNLNGYVYDSNMELMRSSQYGFRIRMYLEAGQTYVLAVSAADSTGLGAYSVALEQAHNFQSQVTQAPTCTEDGIRTITCSYCGYSYEEAIDAAHTWGPGEVVTAPGCETQGSVKYTCTVCGEEKTESTEPLGHNFTEEVITAHTCTENGLAEYTCQTCGYSYRAMIPAAHTLDEGVVTVEPTCNSEGTIVRTCSVCNQTFTDPMPRLEHSFVDAVCTRCGFDLMHDAPVLTLDTATTVSVNIGRETYYIFTPEKTETYTVTSSSSNYDPYVSLYDTNLRRIATDDDGANNLNFSLTYTLQEGVTYVFGFKYLGSQSGSYSVTLTVTHTFMPETITAPTCTEDGLLRYTCAYCDESYTEPVRAGHVIDFSAGICTGCGMDAPISGTCGNKLTWNFDTVYRTLTISGTGAMNDFAAEAPWAHLNRYIDSVSVDAEVTSLGSNAFRDAYRLQMIRIYGTLESIGSNAFTGCEALSDVYFYGNAPEIASDAFTGVTAYVYYTSNDRTWTSSVRKNYGGRLEWRGWSHYIDGGDLGNGYWELYSDGGLYLYSDTVIPTYSSAEAYPWYAYADQIVNISFNIPNVPNNVCQNYENLNHVYFSNRVVEIGQSAFAGCESLNSMHFEGNAPVIAGDAFTDVIANATYPGGNETWTDAVRANYGGNLHWIESIYTLAHGEFPGGSWNLESNGYMNINSNSQYMPIFDHAADFPWHAYRDRIVNLQISGIRSISDYAFQDCENLRSVTIMGEVESIGSKAFAGCDDLTQIHLETEAPEIADDAFEDVTAEVYYPEPYTSWTGDKLVNYGGELYWYPAAIVIENGYMEGECEWSLMSDGTLNIYGYYSNAYMPSYDRAQDYPWYEFADQITYAYIQCGNIGAHAFENYTKLVEVQLNNAEQIGAAAFAGCTALNYIYFGSDAPEIAADAFSDVTATASYPGNNSTWTSSVRKNYGGDLSWYERPYVVDHGQFGDIYWAYYSSKSLSIYPYNGSFAEMESVDPDEYPWYKYADEIKHVNISNASVGNGAFRKYAALETLSLYRVDEIDLRAFAYCSNLKTIYMTGHQVPEIGSNSFYDVTANVYYRALTAQWDSDLFLDYGGDLSWYPEGYLAAPILTAGNVASTGKIKLTWGEVSGAVKYEVYRSTDKKNWTLLKTVSGTSLTNSSTEAGELYYYYVVAVDADGKTSERSEIVSRTCDLPCPVVTVANIASSGKIKLTWKAIKGAVKYEVYRSTDKETWTKLSTVSGTSLTNSSAEAGKLYYYKVRAIASDTAANSAYSTVKSRRCDLPRPVVTLSNIASSGKIKISWEKIDGAVKYEVYRSTDNATWTKLSTVTGTYLNNTSAVGGTRYYYKVRAIASNSEANSAYSTVKNRYCDLARPVITLSNVASSGKIKISWAAVTGAVKYEVYRSTDNETWTLLKTTTSTSLTNTSTTAGTRYYYKVKAIASNSSADSAFSVVSNRTCDLARPTLTVKLNSKDKPVLTWTKVAGAVKYEVYRSTDNKTWTKLKTTTGTSLTNTSAVSGTTYYYKVRAIASNTAANSAYSTVKSVTAG